MKVYRITRHLLILGLIVASVGVSAPPSWAQDDVPALIRERAAAHGVDGAYLVRVASCETGGTFSPTAVGDSGNSLGLFQLHRHGLLPRFYSMGYSDPFNAWENADFAATMFAAGLASHWSCR